MQSMDLKSGYPFWAVKNGLLHAFPPLDDDRRCDVAVIGGGITGALVADALHAADHDVVVLERRDIGWGSTCASTALIQYEIDTPMAELASRYGEDAAALAYRACAEAVDMIGARARTLGDVGHAPMRSLYLASRARDVDTLASEYRLRRRHGLPVARCDARTLQARYGLHAPAALVTRRAAGLDPYRMTYRLLERMQRRGGAVFDRTTVRRIAPHGRGVRLDILGGGSVRARHVVIAAGYETQSWLPMRIARNRSTYACVSDPLEPAQLGTLRDCMLWETARPYLYLRTTPDLRVLVGGGDDAIDVPALRDARVPRKVARLLRHVAELAPGLSLVPAFAWAGTFAETGDGLPFFDAHPTLGPRVLVAMAYGGNGITYAALGAELLQARIERRRHRLDALFGFARLSR
jgi:glycine/D-amino acid oxidase-like deaminating enzyme